VPEARPIPVHLLKFVVEQDYEQYTAVDQAVWRFVLLQLSTRLRETAHPAYRDGLSSTGISVDRIPRIEEMNECLGRFGWGAVCVDGFIPPRAFQEFQAAGYLPIAADMRTLEHLVYTPAPDIIHEAAGHAPILSDPEYAAYIRRSGEVGARAFTSPHDGLVYRAIYELSEIKENPAATPEEIARAERAVEEVFSSSEKASEASRLARLYWWTAEYGLVGTPDDYKLYGAGLLSSLGESHSCHDPSVKKLPLDIGCLDVAYDITRPQPQLFVAKDFADLERVLAEAERTLACARGGAYALERALESRELATLSFEAEREAIGTLAAVPGLRGRPVLLRLTGPVAFARAGLIVPGLGPDTHPAGHLVLLGAPRARSLSSAAQRIAEAGSGEVDFASGVKLSGRGARAVRDASGELVAVRFDGALVVDPEQGTCWDGPFTWWLAGDFVTARAGASDPSFYEPTPRSTLKVPKRRTLPEREARLLGIYEQALAAARRGGSLLAEFERIEALLEESFPDEWLLRWNLLESLLKAGQAGDLLTRLRHELEALEERFERRQPIASGLRYLGSLGQSSRASW
jgi:phenylalanine-4-hydroxylase